MQNFNLKRMTNGATYKRPQKVKAKTKKGCFNYNAKENWVFPVKKYKQ